jgi:hypothetical protein
MAFVVHLATHALKVLKQPNDAIKYRPYNYISEPSSTWCNNPGISYAPDQ